MPRFRPENRSRARAGLPRVPLPPGFSTIWTTVALDLVGFGIVLPVLPLYAKKFGASPLVVGLIVASFSVAQLVLSPLWGMVSDHIGRKPVLVVSLAGTAVGSLLTGLAGGLPLLFLGRIVDGASGASVSVAQAAVADVAHPGERARLFGLLGAAFGLGFVLGPAIGGLLSLVSPRLPFLVAAAVAGANALVAVRRLPETHRPSRSGSVAGGVQGAARASSRRAEHLDRPSDAPGATPQSSTGPHRRSVLGMPGVPGLLVVSFLSLVSFSAFEATFALFGSRRLALTESSTYALFAVIGVLIAVDQVVLVRRAVARWGERGGLQLGLALNAAGLAVLGSVHSLIALGPCLLLLTAGQGLVTPTLSSAVAGQAEPHERGRVLGFQQSAGGFARVVGPIAGGAAFGHLGVWVPYAGGAVVLAVALALCVSAPDRSPEPASV